MLSVYPLKTKYSAKQITEHIKHWQTGDDDVSASVTDSSQLLLEQILLTLAELLELVGVLQEHSALEEENTGQENKEGVNNWNKIGNKSAEVNH